MPGAAAAVGVGGRRIVVPRKPDRPEDGAGDQHRDADQGADQDATALLPVGGGGAPNRVASVVDSPELAGRADGLRRIRRRPAGVRRIGVVMACRAAGGHLDRALVAVGGLFGQPGGDHVVQRRRDGVAVLGRFGRRHDHVAHRDLLERGAGEGQLAGQAFVEHARKGVHVAAGPDLAVAEAFGGHVGPRAEGGTD